MGGNLELPFEFDDFVLSFDAILGVEIAFSADSLIEVLLLLHLRFVLHVLFFEFCDEVLLEFDFFDHLHQISVSFIGIL